MTRDRLRRFNRTDVDGVPCVWMENGSAELLAGLLFRVGYADETLRLSGISHLVEHLALPARPVPGMNYNGTTDMLTTLFWMWGDPDRIVEEIARVPERLSSPPHGRLGAERSILRAEAETRSGGDSWRLSMTLRFGPSAHGLGGYRELAPYAASDEDIVRWSRTRFTAANAVLYLTGKPPRRLALDLPPGRARAIPRPRPIDYIRYPSVYPHGYSGVVAVALVCRRSAAMISALVIAVDRLRDHLRFAAATTYHVDWRYEPLDRERAHVLIWADSLSVEVQATRNRMLGVLEELALTGPTDEELDGSLAELERFQRDPDSVPAHLYHYALDLLLGRPEQSLRETIEERRQLTTADVSEALRMSLPSMLLLLPSDQPIPGGRFTPYPTDAPEPAKGRVFKPRKTSRIDPAERIVVGPDGVGARGDGWRSAVPYSRCIGVQRWSDGTRKLWSNDGFTIAMDPADWVGGSAAIAEIDALSPRDTWIDMEVSSAADSALAEIVADDDWEAQIPRLQRELELDPGNADALNYLVRAFIATQRWAQALRAAERACEISPGDAWAHTMRARALMRLGRESDAADVVKEAVRLDPGGAHTLSDAAWLLSDVEEELAFEYARRAVELHPDEGQSWFAEGALLEETGKHEEAEVAYRRAIEVEPDQSMWHNNLGWNLVLQDRHVEAAAPLERALELNPENDRALHNLAAVRGMGGDLDGARTLRLRRLEPRQKILREEIAAHPDDLALRGHLVDTLTELGRPEDALVAAREALDIAPDDPATLRRAAWSALAAGQREESRAQLARLTAVAGRNAASHQYEAELAALLGDAEIAAQAARTVREEGGGKISRTLAAGYAAAAAGSWVRARKRFEAALLLYPNGCCSHTWLGLAAVVEGDTAVAHSAYERAEAIEMCECASRLRLRAELEPA